jgi:hypothetical protein
MAKQQPVRHYIDDTGAAGRWSQNVREGQGSQINEQHAGFRARKVAMHNQDGVVDRKEDQPATQGRPKMEERESLDEGTKEESGKTHYKDG